MLEEKVGGSEMSMQEWLDEFANTWGRASFGEFLLFCIAMTLIVAVVASVAVVLWAYTSKFVMFGIVGYLLASCEIYQKLRRRGCK